MGVAEQENILLFMRCTQHKLREEEKEYKIVKTSQIKSPSAVAKAILGEAPVPVPVHKRSLV